MTALFPSLKRCDLGMNTDWPRNIQPFISPSLVDVSLHFSYTNVYGNDIMLLPKHLHRLHLSGYFSASDVQSFSCFHGLADLSILSYVEDQHDLINSLFSSLPCLTALRRLAVKLHPDSRPPPVLVEPCRTISALEVQGRPSHIASFAKSFSNLDEVTLQFNVEDSDRMHVIPCFQTIAQASKISLRSIMIHFITDDVLSISRPWFPLASCIDALLYVKVMERFVFIPPPIPGSSYDLEDQDVSSMVHQWTNLKELMFGPMSTVSLRGLRTIAQLRHLKVLEVRCGSRVCLPALSDPFHGPESAVQSFARTLFPPQQFQPINHTIAFSDVIAPMPIKNKTTNLNYQRTLNMICRSISHPMYGLSTHIIQLISVRCFFFKLVGHYI